MHRRRSVKSVVWTSLLVGAVVALLVSLGDHNTYIGKGPTRKVYDVATFESRVAISALVGSVVAVLAFVAQAIREAARRTPPAQSRADECWKCGYDRAGLTPDAPCPECGAKPG